MRTVSPVTKACLKNAPVHFSAPPAVDGYDHFASAFPAAFFAAGRGLSHFGAIISEFHASWPLHNFHYEC